MSNRLSNFGQLFAKKKPQALQGENVIATPEALISGLNQFSGTLKKVLKENSDLQEQLQNVFRENRMALGPEFGGQDDPGTHHENSIDQLRQLPSATRQKQLDVLMVNIAAINAAVARTKNATGLIDVSVQLTRAQGLLKTEREKYPNSTAMLITLGENNAAEAGTAKSKVDSINGPSPDLNPAAQQPTRKIEIVPLNLSDFSVAYKETRHTPAEPHAEVTINEFKTLLAKNGFTQFQQWHTDADKKAEGTALSGQQELNRNAATKPVEVTEVLPRQTTPPEG